MSAPIGVWKLNFSLDKTLNVGEQFVLFKTKLLYQKIASPSLFCFKQSYSIKNCFPHKINNTNIGPLFCKDKIINIVNIRDMKANLGVNQK